jgi:hypothetical protein
MSGIRSAAAIECGADEVLERCHKLNPPNTTQGATLMAGRCGSTVRA